MTNLAGGSSKPQKNLENKDMASESVLFLPVSDTSKFLNDSQAHFQKISSQSTQSSTVALLGHSLKIT